MNASPLSEVRDWSHQRFAQELQSNSPDFNLLASFSKSLALDRLQGNSDASILVDGLQRLLPIVANRRIECRERIDIYLAMAFLEEERRTGRGGTSGSLLRDCLQTSRLFNLANALTLVCGHTDYAHEEVIPDGLRRLTLAQTSDGAFRRRDGSASYYLTTHALLALSLCDADPTRILLARERLEKAIPSQLEQGFVDGVAESLVFLRLTGLPAREEKSYLAWLGKRQLSNGGFCFRQSRGCLAHWHPASLMYYLLLEIKSEEGT